MCVSQLISKITTDGLTKDKVYERLSAIFLNQILILNDHGIKKFYNLKYFKEKGEV